MHVPKLMFFLVCSLPTVEILTTELPVNAWLKPQGNSAMQSYNDSAVIFKKKNKKLKFIYKLEGYLYWY